ncbi:MAG: MFS transporter [Clostridia bacterium]|nr:MFS transporter [Clostridia bacterium]
MKKRKIFDLSAISIIACDCLQAVICIFIDLFFVSQILHNPNAESVAQNIVSIGLFYVIYYFILTSSYSVAGFALRKINKSIFVSIGAIVLTVVVFLVYILETNGIDLSTFVPLIAVLYGIGFGCFSNGYNNLTGETISSKHQVKFFAVKKIMFQATYIIFPITLGLIIDKINFAFMALIMLVICAALIVFSFLIKPKKTYSLSFNLRSFGKYLRKNKKETKPLWLMYISNFFRGASYDCFTTLITILVMSTFQSNTSLGMFQSIFTACSLVTMCFYLKFYRKKRANSFIIPTIVLVAAAVVGILCATNEITIICFYAVYAILNVILMSISDSRRAGVIRVLSLHSHILESNAYGEFFLGAGRITSSLFLVLAGLFDNLMGGGTLFLKIALGLVCGMYVMYGVSLIWLEKALVRQDEEFRRVHIAEEIVKTED